MMRPGIDGVKRDVTKIVQGVNGIKEEVTEWWSSENGIKKLVYQAISYDPVLNNNQWVAIRQAADDGIASSIWSVGDRKSVVLNGTCAGTTFDNSVVYAYILGFNHNKGYEGDNTIHFQFGFTELNNGSNICFVDRYYDKSVSSGYYFKMNDSNSNSGGWRLSKMRNNVVPDFIKCIEQDLVSVLKVVNKYTLSSTKTSDSVFLLSEKEITGSIDFSDDNTKHQKWYPYYSNGNSSVKKRHSSTSSSAMWWLRSSYDGTSNWFCAIDESGKCIGRAAWFSLGFAPAFCV